MSECHATQETAPLISYLSAVADVYRALNLPKDGFQHLADIENKLQVNLGYLTPSSAVEVNSKYNKVIKEFVDSSLPTPNTTDREFQVKVLEQISHMTQQQADTMAVHLQETNPNMAMVTKLWQRQPIEAFSLAYKASLTKPDTVRTALVSQLLGEHGPFGGQHRQQAERGLKMSQGDLFYARSSIGLKDVEMSEPTHRDLRESSSIHQGSYFQEQVSLAEPKQRLFGPSFDNYRTAITKSSLKFDNHRLFQRYNFAVVKFEVKDDHENQLIFGGRDS